LRQFLFELSDPLVLLTNLFTFFNYLDELIIRIETADAPSFEEASRQIAHSFRTAFSIRVNVERSTSGSLPRYEFKSRRFKRVD